MSAIFVAQKAEVIKLLIDAGADVNARDFNRNTALMYARTTQAAQLLLDAGADIHAVNRQRMTVLMGTHSSRCTKLLIDAGADVNAQSRAGLTPLMYSTNAKSTRYLLEAGANPSAIDKEGQTPLMWCVDGTSAQDLIDAGADVNAMSYDTTTPLLAAICQFVEPGGMIVEMGGLREILGVADPLKDRLETIFDTARWDNATACHKTSYFKGIVDKIKVLVKAGADVNKKHIISHSMSYSWPPLMTLCCYCDKLMDQQDLVLSVAKLLIEAGADPLAKNSDGQTAEDLASDNPKLADYLHGLTHFPEELDLFK
jgi:ankyrin repeat protein